MELIFLEFSDSSVYHRSFVVELHGRVQSKDCRDILEREHSPMFSWTEDKVGASERGRRYCLLLEPGQQNCIICRAEDIGGF